MEYHRNKLKSFCRLCNSEKAIPTDRKPIKKDAQSITIKRALNIDVLGEDPDIYPPFICKCCHVKLNKWKETTRRYKLTNKAINIALAVFESHTQQCTICSDKEEPTTSLISAVSAEALKFGYYLSTTNDGISCFKMSNGNKMVSTLVQVHHSGTWNIEIYGKPAKASPIFHEIPKCLDTSSCHTLFNLIETSTHCIGNNGYDKLCRSKSPNNLTMFFNKHNEIEAYEQDLVTYRTVRHMKCEILITQNSSSRCSVCSIYRSYLSTQNSINNKNVLTDATNQKYTRNDLLSRQVLEGKTRKLQKENEQLKRKVQNLQDRVRHVIEEKGETLDEDLSTSFSSVMNDKNDEVMSCFPADSAQRIFWQQQKQAVEVKSKTQRRWHPMMIKWCIALHAKSSSAYRFLRSTNMLILPGESTLRDYTKFSTTTDGVNYDIIRRIKEEMKEEPEFKRNVSLLFDEVKIKSGLVYSSASGKLIGFCNLGSINEEIENYVEKLKISDNDVPKDDTPLASHVLAFMVRGIFSPLREVFGWFPCCGFSSQQLYWAVWEAVDALEYASFMVRAFVSDGATPNRKFYRIHGNPADDNITHCTTNPFDKNRMIYFICDVPHLIKTTRNNWENSGWNSKTRNLHYQNQPITWVQLINLIDDDIGNERQARLRKLPKISYEHIHLKPSSRMRVKTAAQVLSSSVAKAFEASSYLHG